MLAINSLIQKADGDSSMTRSLLSGFLAGATLALTVAAAPSQDYRRLRGAILIDGSSTVYPITEAVAEEFSSEAPRVKTTVGVSGTGGGFKRFAAGETDVSNASRAITAKEIDACTKDGVNFIEIPVAYDGLTIVLNKKNDWVDNLTVDELKKIYLAGSPAMKWSDVRAGWPDTMIKVYSPGTDSGTFDYFKEIVAGKTESIRSDMQVSEDDNVLVRGVAGDTASIGFFGCAYYFENAGKLKACPIVNKQGKAVLPNKGTIESGTYNPFSRPLFIYVNKKSADRPEIQGFIGFYLENAGELSEEVGYVRLPQEVYDRCMTNFENGRTGTQFLKDGEKVHGPLPSIYK
jgi:phosphate transport system substrate-binding protein